MSFFENIKFKAANKRYKEKFGEDFPLMLAQNYSIDEIVEAVDECIETGKEFGWEDIDENGKYKVWY